MKTLVQQFQKFRGPAAALAAVLALPACSNGNTPSFLAWDNTQRVYPQDPNNPYALPAAPPVIDRPHSGKGPYNGPTQSEIAAQAGPRQNIIVPYDLRVSGIYVDPALVSGRMPVDGIYPRVTLDGVGCVETARGQNGRSWLECPTPAVVTLRTVAREETTNSCRVDFARTNAEIATMRCMNLELNPEYMRRLRQQRSNRYGS